MGKDMTKGSPLKLILLFSIPLLIGNLFQQFYNMADTIIVGQTVGVSALAAVGATGSVSFLVLGFAMGLTNGFSVITAQRFGAGDAAGVRRSVCTSIVLSIASTVILTALSMALAMPILKIMNTPEDIIQDSYNYIIVIFGGIFASFFYNLFGGILRAIGDSKTPLYFLILSSVLNIGLDFLMILVFKMGVAGAAYATVISQALSGVLCLVYSFSHYKMLRPEREDWEFSWGFAWKHLQVGIPMALQFSVTAIGIMILQSALNGFGSTVVAAYTAASKVEIIFTQPMVTLGVAVSTFAAQNLGAMKYKRIRQGVRVTSGLSVGATALAAAAVVFLGRFFVSLFIDEPTEEIFSAARLYLNTVAIFFIALAFLFLFRYALQGMGSAAVTVLAGVLELLMRALACKFLPPYLGFKGVCLATPLAWVGAALPLMFIYFYKVKKLPEDGTPFA